MFVEWVWLKRSALTLTGLGLLGSACSAVAHDCYERRDCPEAVAIDPSSEPGGGDAGSGERAEPRPGEAGAAGASASEASADADADADAGSGETGLPRVLRVTPIDGALGVKRDARIVITFNRPMNRAATQAAYESNDLPAAGLGFSWNASATVLTLSPRAPLEYAERPQGAAANAELPPRVYHYGFDERAVDELGQALAPAAFTFSTLRQVSLQLDAEPERTGNWTEGEGEGIHNCMRVPKAGYAPTVCVGDDINNVRYSGFLSFGLSRLPDSITAFSSAHLLANALVHGSPSQLGSSRLEHVSYGELDAAALSIAPHSSPSPLFVAASLSDRAELALTLDVTTALSDDYENRVAREKRSQYRLAFAQILANDHWDDVELPTSSIHLSVSFLVP